MTDLTRRGFLKVGAAGALGATGVSVLGFNVAEAKTLKQNLRIEGAKVSHSICPYCAVGCALLAYTKTNGDGKVGAVELEGHPDSPVNEGRLCPKGASAMDLAVSRMRLSEPQYRAPGA